MQTKSLDLKYSIKNLWFIIYLQFIFIGGAIFFIVCLPYTFLNVLFIISCLLFSIYFTYLFLNRIKKLTIAHGTIKIERYWLSAVTYNVKDITVLSGNALNFGKKRYALHFVLNKKALISLLVDAMQIEDSEYVIENMISGLKLYKNDEDIKKEVKQKKLSLIVSGTITILFFVLLIVRAISNQLPLIYPIGFVLFVLAFLFIDKLCEKKLEELESKYAKFICSQILPYLLSIIIAIILSMLIFQIFQANNMNLMLITL